MVAGVWLIVAASLAAAPPVPVAVQTAQSDARLEQAALAIDDGKFASALLLAGHAQKGRRLSSSDEDWAAYLTARAQAALGDTSLAERTMRERQRAHPNSYTWASLVSILMICGRHEQAADAILGLAESDFVLANRLKPGVIENIVAALEESNAPVRDRLVARLVEGRYSGPASQHVPDGLRLRFINLLLRQNRIEDAARQTQALEAPGILSILLTDKSFSPLWEQQAVRALMAPGALVARVERGVQARLEQKSLTAADWLELMRALRVVGRADEAVRLGLHAVEQARSEKRAAGPALRLEIAYAYADQGESWAARRTARELLKEEVSLPVALRVAIAEVLEMTGDDEGALQLLGTLGDAAKLAPALATTVCAAHDLGWAARRDAALTSLEIMNDAPRAALLDAYVCSGEQEKAALVLASMFERPALRASAILTAQLYADPSKPGTDQSDLRYRMRALVASTPVQDAIKAYARTLGLPFTSANSR